MEDNTAPSAQQVLKLPPSPRYGDGALPLHRRGYPPIPTKGKAPVEKDWTRHATEQSEADVRRLVQRYPNHNVGIVTGQIVGLDLDVLDKTVVKEIASLAIAKLGPALFRVGRSPKGLLVYRTDAPFPKITGCWFVSADGKKHRIECLGAGQQFVAFGIHPDTNQPYRWAGPSLLDTAAADLTPITERQMQAFIPEAEQVLLCHGFQPVVRTATTTTIVARSGTARPETRPLFLATRGGLVEEPSVSTNKLNDLRPTRPLGPDFSPPHPYTKNSYPATGRLHELFQEHNDRVRPAVRQLVEEIGAAGCGRHDGIVAIAGRLVHQRWTDQEAIGFLLPLVNDNFQDGDWRDEIEKALAHARGRDSARLQAMRGTTWPR